MFDHFSLTLIVNHACNLRCAYCYTGLKFARAMPDEVGDRAIRRALASLRPGGRLDLGFFGGEPLLEAGRILRFVAFARGEAGRAGVGLAVSVATNGTVDSEEARRVMGLPETALAVSHDGLPEVHDRRRRTAGGLPTSTAVLATIDRLVGEGTCFRAVMVVCPDSAALFPEGIRFLRRRGVRFVDLSLDLWSRWTEGEVAALEAAVSRGAQAWREGLPGGVSWYDEKAALLAGEVRGARCGFGNGEVAVAPSGRLYPCERVVGEDAFDHPLRLAGDVFAGEDFLPGTLAPGRSHPACGSCVLAEACNTTCRCSSWVRTGDVRRPDGLLCRLNQACLRETGKHLTAWETAGGGPAARIG